MSLIELSGWTTKAAQGVRLT